MLSRLLWLILSVIALVGVLFSLIRAGIPLPVTPQVFLLIILLLIAFPKLARWLVALLAAYVVIWILGSDPQGQALLESLLILVIMVIGLWIILRPLMDIKINPWLGWLFLFILTLGLVRGCNSF